MKNTPPSLMLIAGEASADAHGAALVRQLRIQSPGISVCGIGGPKLHQEGMEIIEDISAHAVVGFWEVVKHLKFFQTLLNRLLEEIRIRTPHALILIDFPGFNLKLAQEVKDRFPHIKIIYYISPQVWAWGKNRLPRIKKLIDMMLVIFPFEADFYRQHGIAARFVGHPLMEQLHAHLPVSPPGIGGHPHSPQRIGLLPGSRQLEIKRHLPVMLAAVRELSCRHSIECFLFRAQTIDKKLLDETLQKYVPPLPVRIIDTDHPHHLQTCDYAWVCSGTATLETALLGVPLLLIYKTSFCTWLLSRYLITIPYIGLVNIVAGKQLAPEFIQYRATAANLCKETIRYLTLPNVAREERLAQLRALRQTLGTGSASINTAHAILELLSAQK